ncbi:CBO0543 family protein [Anaerobacillus sp. MEB173]|uniref:CBO0543 family protein n=1 Tax=Anaerobacillus sp. MEB173 TaxID=3383345 RepID=UPI003F91E0AD
MLSPDKDVEKLIEKQYVIIDKANTNIVEIWIEHIVFSAGWWIGLCLLILPWLLWIIFRKKESTNRLLIGGVWVAFIATFLNYAGVSMGLWHYDIKLIPIMPDFLAWDFALLPVTVMFFIQIKPNIKPLVKALIFSALTAFIGEPLFKWLGFFDYPNWHYLASVPFYVVIYLIANKLVNGTNFDSVKT